MKKTSKLNINKRNIDRKSSDKYAENCESDTSCDSYDLCDSCEEKIYTLERRIRENKRIIAEKEDARVDASDLITVALSAFLGFLLALFQQIVGKEYSPLEQSLIILLPFTIIIIVMIFIKVLWIDEFLNAFDKKKIKKILDLNEELYKRISEIEKQINNEFKRELIDGLAKEKKLKGVNENANNLFNNLNSIEIRNYKNKDKEFSVIRFTRH